MRWLGEEAPEADEETDPLTLDGKSQSCRSLHPSQPLHPTAHIHLPLIWLHTPNSTARGRRGKNRGAVLDNGGKKAALAQFWRQSIEHQLRSSAVHMQYCRRPVSIEHHRSIPVFSVLKRKRSNEVPGEARSNQLKTHLPPSVNSCFGEEMKEEAQREHHGSYW